jgi:hypothetical protein
VVAAARQPEQALGVPGDLLANRDGVRPPCRGEARDREADVRGLVALPAVWDGRQIRRVGFGEETIGGNEPDERVVGPLAEGYDAAEGDVPAGGERLLGERVGPGVGVEHADHACGCCVGDERPGVLFGLARMHDDGAMRLGRQLDLAGEGVELPLSRGVVVMVVEAALTHCDGAAIERRSYAGEVARSVEVRRVVWVHAGGMKDEARVPRR